MPSLTVSPLDGQQDERLDITVDGVVPGTRVELTTHVVNMFGPWESVNVYVARADGTVDLRSQAPVKGTYRGIDVMGPVWSASWAADVPLAPPDVRDVTRPNTITFTARVNGDDVDTITCTRRYVAAGIRRSDVRAPGVVGTLFEHADGVARPGIVMMGGSAPLIPEHIAAPVAAHGFTVLAIAFFGMGEGTPDQLSNVPLENFAAAALHLLDQPSVIGPRVGMFGASKGGEAAPLIAASFPDLFGAVVAEAASGYVGGAMSSEDTRASSWALGGHPLPFIRSTEEAIAAYRSGDPDTPQSLVPVWESALHDPDRAKDAEIRVENATCPILYLNGGDDRLWPAHAFTSVSIRRLAEANYPHPFEEIVFEGCGHVLHPPYTPVDIPALKHPVLQMTNAYGGTVEGNARASVEHWSRLLDFFNEHLRGPSVR